MYERKKKEKKKKKEKVGLSLTAQVSSKRERCICERIFGGY